MRRKVAIVGCAESTRQEVSRLYGNTDFEIWGLNQLYNGFPSVVPSCTRWFNIHHEDRWLEKDHNHLEFLKKLKIPVIMRRKYEEIPNSQAYPKAEVLEMFGSYFTSQISWMVALGIYEGFEEIHIYGCDMAMSDEYAIQRPSLEYLIGYARGKGIVVYVPRGSDLLKACRLYGFEDNDVLCEKVLNDKKHWGDKINATKMEMLKSRDERMKIMGALDGRIDDEIKRAFAEKKLVDLRQHEERLRDEMNQYVGMTSALDYIGRAWVHG